MFAGPFIGGILLAWFSWRSIFFLNIPIGLISLSIIFTKKDKEILTKNSLTLNLESSLLLGTSLIIFLILLNQISGWSQHRLLYIFSLGIAFSSLSLFIYLQKKLPHPLIPLTLFNHLPFIGCLLGIGLEQYGFSAIIVSLGLYLQKILLFSSLKTSLIYLFLSLVFGVMAALSGKLVDKIGLKISIVAGLSIMTIGLLLFSMVIQVNTSSSISIVCGIIGIGMGCASCGLNTAIIKVVEQQYVGIASSMFVISALIGNAVGVTATSLMYEMQKAQGIRDRILITTGLIFTATLICNTFFKETVGSKALTLSSSN